MQLEVENYPRGVCGTSSNLCSEDSQVEGRIQMTPDLDSGVKDVVLEPPPDSKSLFQNMFW